MPEDVVPTPAFGRSLEAYRLEPGQEIPEWIVNEAFLINEALSKGIIGMHDAERGLADDESLKGMMRDMVRVTYFVEYPPESVPLEERGQALLELFQQEVPSQDGEPMILADYLHEHRQSVSLAMITLDDSTATAIRYLEEKGVPVNAWIVLRDDQGYWTNRTNIAETAERAREVMDWVEAEGLTNVGGIGFDIEKPIEFIRGMVGGSSRKDLLKAELRYRRDAWGRGSKKTARADLEGLIQEVAARGYETETYVMPRFMKNLLGGMDIDPAIPDRYIEMVYTNDPPAPRKNGLGVRLLRNLHAIPDLGIISGVDGASPGRQLKEKDPTKPDNHLALTELAEHIGVLLKQEVDIPNRKFDLRDVYLFALNGERVARMAERALDLAFAQHK